jgi:hypothetical protein
MNVKRNSPLNCSSEDLARRLLSIGFKHLIFSLPPGDAKQTLDNLDARAKLAWKHGSISA